MPLWNNIAIKGRLLHRILLYEQEGNADPTLKPDFVLLFFQSNEVSLPFEGHNVAYQRKILDQSNTVCEYEVNLSTNEKVITEKQNFYTKC